MTRLTPPQCNRCRTTMEEGVLLDVTHHGRMQPAEWLQGAPERSFWQGLKTKGKEQHTVVTFRCPRCGLLESYAPDSPA